MARFRRRFRRRFGAASGRFRRSAKRGFGISMPFAAGIIAGYTDIDKHVPAELVLGAATVPMKLGKIKAVAQGMVMGNLIKSLMAKKGLSGAKAGGLL